MADNKLRLPLAVPTTPRGAEVDKDATLNNAYIDKSKTGTTYAVKRPGFYVGSEAITVGDYRGVFVNPNDTNTGSTPGETTVWYIGPPATEGGPVTLGSITSAWEPPPEPTDETLVFSAYMETASINDSATIYYLNALGSQFIVFDMRQEDMFGDPPARLAYYIGADAVPVIILEDADVTAGVYKITYDATSYYVYLNDVVIATSPFVPVLYSLPGTGNGGLGVVTDAEFGPPTE